MSKQVKHQESQPDPNSLAKRQGRFSVNRSAFSRRVQKWTNEEKNCVLQKLRSGCTSIVEISRYVGETKSLRQVAEYIELLKLQSLTANNGQPDTVPSALRDENSELDDPDQTDKAEDVSDSHAEGHHCAAWDVTNISDGADEYLKTRSILDARKWIGIFDSKFGTLLAQLVTGSDDADISEDAYAYMFAALVQFLERVLLDALFAGSFKRPDRKRSRESFAASLTLDQICKSLEICGYTERALHTEIMDMFAKNRVGGRLSSTAAALDADDASSDSGRSSMDVDGSGSPDSESGSDSKESSSCESSSESDASSA